MTATARAALCVLAASFALSTAPAIARPMAEDLTDRVWVVAETDPDRPGPMVVFLSDGTLIQDSCWETYRLSSWTVDGAGNLSWDEDSITIEGTITLLEDDRLEYDLYLGDETVSYAYVAATVPFLCPDMLR